MRFTTGVMRVHPDRRTITLPVVGALRSKESTRHLERLVSVGNTRILSATLSERWGRLFVSFSCIVEAHPHQAPTRDGRAGVDLGLRVLATVAEARAPSPKSPTPLPCGPRSKSVARWDDNSLDAYPAHTATEQRKPSSPGWTAESCTCAERHTTSSPRCWRTPTARS